MVRPMTRALPSAGRRDAIERWRIDCSDGDVATLTIPADARRARRFEIDCRFVVAQRAPGARHGMRVEVDGVLEWAREAPTENPGDTDSMDYHFRRDVPVGRPLAVVVKTTVHLARRMRITVEAEEA
jgi:hypothetical protein